MARLLKGPTGFSLGEYCHNNHDSWPGYAGTFTWLPAWIKYVGSDTAHVHPIDHRGDWNGLFKIMGADGVRVTAAEIQQDLGFTHCKLCGFEVFDCECPEQFDVEDLL